MRIHRSCHCKRIIYEAEVDPDKVTICHCTDCQMLTGTAYRVSVPTATADFELLSGSPKLYVKVGDSGAKRVQAFCPDCGSPLYTHALEQPQTYGLRVGTIAERAALSPKKQKWCSSALGWSMNIEALPRAERE